MTLLDVIKRATPSLEENIYINAMWIEGSWATGKNNDQSDIDVWLDVKEGTFDECIAAFRQALTNVGDIDWEEARGIYSHVPKLQKHIFHLAGFPGPQRIELDLQEHSRNFIFDESKHTIKIIFDKNKTIQWVNRQ